MTRNIIKNNSLYVYLSIIALFLPMLGACSSTGGHPSRYADTWHNPARAYAPGENYAALQENGRKRVTNEPVSTFSIDVDTAAYANVRRFVQSGQLPPVDAVRVEELINYFNYSYGPPADIDSPFNIVTEVGPTPWNSGSYLLHVGIKGYEPARPQQTNRNLVFLIDVSGSMRAENKLGLLKKSLRLLVNQLTARDRVAIVVYAGASGVVLPSTSADQTDVIQHALQRLRAGGSTNGGAGIQLAYAIAQQHFIEDGVNRVILATDGDFNVGLSGTNALTRLIKRETRAGVGLTILGFGMGNYNDHMLESISNAGDGVAAYIDTLQEANKVLVNDINATLHTIARDTKVQIEFNPNVVSSYRLIGYENRLLDQEDFTDDRVDAGDIGAGHTVTALYEITLNRPLRYERVETPPANSDNELGFLKIRYRLPDEPSSRELQHAIFNSDINTTLAETSEDFRFSAAVAAFGLLMRESEQIGHYQLADVLALAQQSRGHDEFGYRGAFLQLVNLANSLQ